MKCVCERDCWIPNPEGKNQFYARGDVVDFKKKPEHFRALKKKVDFDTAKEQELLAADFNLDELKEYIETKYNRKPGNRGKDKMVAMLLDCRFRAVDIDPNMMV